MAKFCGYQDLCVAELTKLLHDLFYTSIEGHSERKRQANKILAELKTRFAETGI